MKLLHSLYIILLHYQRPFSAYLVQLPGIEKWMQQCKSTDNRHIIPQGYDIKCTAICALNGSLCQVEVSTRETRECCIRIQHLCEHNCLTTKMDRLSPPVCDVLWNIHSATLENQRGCTMVECYLCFIWESFVQVPESHSGTRGLLRKSNPCDGGVGIICLFYQPCGGSTKATVWLCSAWKPSMPAVPYRK